MTVSPMPIRMEKELLDLLNEGARRTSHKKQELVRLTLRRHLRSVIDAEAAPTPTDRITNIEPWPKGALTNAYRKLHRDGWDEVEAFAARAQRKPSFED